MTTELTLGMLGSTTGISPPRQKLIETATTSRGLPVAELPYAPALSITWGSGKGASCIA